MMTIKRRAAGHYEAVVGGEVVGEVILDGRPGVDDYPWTWSVAKFPYGSGPSATKRSACAELRQRLGR